MPPPATPLFMTCGLLLELLLELLLDTTFEVPSYLCWCAFWRRLRGLDWGMFSGRGSAPDGVIVRIFHSQKQSLDGARCGLGLPWSTRRVIMEIHAPLLQTPNFTTSCAPAAHY